MEIRQLEMFLTVAREAHFGRSAEILHVSQPALSQSIKRLESSLGVRLFHRTTRRVELSDAGRVFEREVTTILELLRRAGNAAREAELGSQGVIRIGFPTLYPQSVLPRLTTYLREHHPTIELHPQIVPSRAQLVMINEGELDAGFVWLWPHGAGPSVQDLELTLLSRHAMVAAVPANSPLAMLPEPLDIRSLRHENFVLFPSAPDIGSVTRDAAFAVCKGYGFTPHVVREIPGYQVVLELVGSGVGVSLLPDAIKTVDVPGVVRRRINVRPQFSFQFVSRSATDSAVLRTLNTAVARVANLARTAES